MKNMRNIASDLDSRVMWFESRSFILLTQCSLFTELPSWSREQLSTQYWTLFHALITLLNMFHCRPTSCLTTSDPKSSLLKRSTSTTESQFCFRSSGLWVQSLLQNIVEQNGSITPQSLLYRGMNLRWTGGVSKVSLWICWTGRI